MPGVLQGAVFVGHGERSRSRLAGPLFLIRKEVLRWPGVSEAEHEFGRVSHEVSGAESLTGAIALFRLSYERAVAAQRPDGGNEAP